MRLGVVVDNYESVMDARMAAMNRLRNWLRDQTPMELWPKNASGGQKQSFGDKDVMDSPILPNDWREWVVQLTEIEKDIKKQLEIEIQEHHLWPWLKSIKGVDVVTAARLIHHSHSGDMTMFPWWSNYWSYAGMDGPGWRQRPHNWTLTSVCFIVGEQFVKMQGGKKREKGTEGIYGILYRERKEYEQDKDWCGKCMTTIEKKRASNGEDIVREKCIPGHIHNKAKRYAVKAFLKDLWLVGNGYEPKYGDTTEELTPAS